MKTKQQFLRWLMLLMLSVSALGVWAQVTTDPDHTCLGTTQDYWADYPTPTPNSTYAWTVDGGETFESGQGTYNIKIKWDMVGTYHIKVIETDKTTGCPGPERTLQVIVDPLPVPNIVGPAPVCTSVSNSTETYSTSNTGNTFLWTVVGGTFTGQGTNQIVVTWTTAGAGSISVIETIGTAGCNATYTLPITINAAPNTTGIFHN